MSPELAPYLHPALAVPSLLCAAYAGVLGLRGRRRPHRLELRRHASLGPWAWGLVLASWATGLLSVDLWRSDLELAASAHFWVGTVIALLFTLSAASRRWMDRPLVRAIHPWFGAAALVLSGFQMFLGLGMMP